MDAVAKVASSKGCFSGRYFVHAGFVTAEHTITQDRIQLRQVRHWTLTSVAVHCGVHATPRLPHLIYLSTAWMKRGRVAKLEGKLPSTAYVKTHNENGPDAAHRHSYSIHLLGRRGRSQSAVEAQEPGEDAERSKWSESVP